MSVTTIPCGFALAIPVGFEGQIRPRSGLATKHFISIPNTPATIDADYRGEVMVPLLNFGQSTFTVTRGMRIAQIVFARTWCAELREVTALPPSERGTGGFGHTGH
jgi:dUTP pyrophosphatase